MHDGVDVGTGAEEFAVDVALGIELTSLAVDRFAIEVELHDVVERDQFGREGAREQEAVGPLRRAHADVTVGVENPVFRERPVCHH